MKMNLIKIVALGSLLSASLAFAQPRAFAPQTTTTATTTQTKAQKKAAAKAAKASAAATPAKTATPAAKPTTMAMTKPRRPRLRSSGEACAGNAGGQDSQSCADACYFQRHRLGEVQGPGVGQPQHQGLSRLQR